MTAPSTRELEYFVAVAEELHFGRAADRLGITQPPLSRAVAGLERRVGVALLTRGNRSVALTPAGEVFLDESRAVLAAVDAAVRRARQAATEPGPLRIVMKPDGDAGLLDVVLPLFRRDADACETEMIVCGIDEQISLLTSGQVDLAFLHVSQDGRQPEDLPGVDSEPLLTQDHIAVLPRTHPHAGRAVLTMDDLHSGPIPLWDGPRPSGVPVRDPGQLMQLVALGEVIALVPNSVRRHARPDVVCLPVRDAPTSSIVLAWPEQTRSRAVAAFVRLCVDAVRERRD